MSKIIKEKTRYQRAESFDHFGLAVTQVQFWKGGSEFEAKYPIPENVNAKGIFDPSVDYMYVNELEFKNWIAPILTINLLATGIDCENTKGDMKSCFWRKPCS